MERVLIVDDRWHGGTAAAVAADELARDRGRAGFVIEWHFQRAEQAGWRDLLLPCDR
jgi:hypothetical protein